MTAKLRIWLGAAAIGLAGLWVYLPALSGGWLSDDDIEIVRNSDLRDLGGLGRIWRGSNAPDYFPVKSSVQWIEWHLWGDRPLGYHLVTLFFHLLSACLLWRILGKLGVRAAWLGGLLFAIHPLAVESVAWISELKNTLSLAWLLVAILAYIEWDTGRARPESRAKSREPGDGEPRLGGDASPYLASLLCFTLAMLSKSSVIMLPAALLLYAWWRRGRIASRNFVTTVPFAAVSLALGVVTLIFQQHRAIRGVALAAGAMTSRFAATGISAAFYLSKSVFPVATGFIYPRWPVSSPTPVQFLPWLVWAVLFFWLIAGRRRAAAFGLGWFLLNLAPVLGFVPMAYLRFSWVADHFAYLSLMGVTGLVAAAVGRDPRARQSVAVVAAICLVLCWLSHRDAQSFRDEQALWIRTLAVNPQASAAHNNLGYLLSERGDLPGAMAEFREALRLDPDYPEARNNLGGALFRSGRVEEAVREFRRALQIDSAYAEVHNNLGDALQALGRFPEAIEEYGKALALKPSYPEAAYNLGTCLAALGRRSEAIAYYERALRLRPAFPQAHNNLGTALAQSGRFDEAIAHYRAALRLDPNYPEAENNFGLALAHSGRMREAQGHFQAAVRLRPDYSDALHNLRVAQDRLEQQSAVR